METIGLIWNGHTFRNSQTQGFRVELHTDKQGQYKTGSRQGKESDRVRLKEAFKSLVEGGCPESDYSACPLNFCQFYIGFHWFYAHLYWKGKVSGTSVYSRLRLNTLVIRDVELNNFLLIVLEFDYFMSIQVCYNCKLQHLLTRVTQG